MPLRKHFPDRLPVAFRPYPSETLSSWMSRAASVYGLSLTELLAECCDWNWSTCEFMDVHLNAMNCFALECLLGCRAEEILACTVSGTSPDLLPLWISHVSPSWNDSERKTVLNAGFRPAVCGYCLAEDLDTGRSQHVRLSWYCSVTTMCPSHRTPLRQCCHDFIPVSDSCGHHREHHTRLHCGSCSHMVDDFSLSGRIDEIACASLANFESALCRAISGKHVSIFSGVAVPGDSLLQFVQDVVWALMRPVQGTPHRIVHALQRDPFRMPFGFNTPVEVSHWLSFGSLPLRRCLLAVVAGILQPENPLWPADFGTLGVGTRRFWRLLRERMSPSAVTELFDRAEQWHPTLYDRSGFY
jgi:hypothetical protein